MRSRGTVRLRGLFSYLELSAIPSPRLGDLTGIFLTLVIPVDLQFFGPVENDVVEGPSEIRPCPPTPSSGQGAQSLVVVSRNQIGFSPSSVVFPPIWWSSRKTAGQRRMSPTRMTSCESKQRWQRVQLTSSPMEPASLVGRPMA